MLLRNPPMLLYGHDVHQVQRRKGNLDSAFELYQDALAIQTGALGPDHPCCGRTTNNMALLLHEQGKLDESLAFYEKALAISSAALGGGHWEVAGTLGNIGDVLKKQGNLSEALNKYKEALDIQVAGYGDGDAKACMYLFFYAGVLLRLGYEDELQPSVKVDEAFAAYARLLSVKERAMLGGDDDASIAEIVDKMGCIKGNLGHFAEANALFSRAHPTYVAHFGKDHPLTTAAAANIEASASAAAAVAAAAAAVPAGKERVARQFQMHSVIFLAMAVNEVGNFTNTVYSL